MESAKTMFRSVRSLSGCTLAGLCFLATLGAGGGSPARSEQGASKGGEQYDKNLSRWKTMSESEREKVRERFRTWNALSDEQQSSLTSRFQHYRSLSPRRRRSYQRLAQRYHRVSPEERERLDTRFALWQRVDPRKRLVVRGALTGILSMEPEQRDRWNKMLPEKRRRFLRGVFRIARNDRRFDVEGLVRAPRERQQAALQRFLILNKDRLKPIFRPIGTVPFERWQSETPFQLSPELGRVWRRLSEVERWEIRRQIEHLKRDRRQGEFERLLRESSED